MSFTIALTRVSGVAASSITVVNSCGSFSQVYGVDARANTVINQPPDGIGVAVNIYTGCTDDTATSCTTGGVNNNSGASPFIRAEATFTGASVNYDISLLHGYNHGMQNSAHGTSPPELIRHSAHTPLGFYGL
ncbi:hypothetical protein GLOTRDRAFT_130648 [Gloeophyllum trabeum ATCC 11539]|uniref:Uncharacterized protein n=1 Tax=Gloeophyllum trabeum (strain ATCC 11539 / FP-39264 / Madison 617) TaxID=670483 RepID=S7Q2Q8_GLOTA|nr:uncharacterized protein GLOTRDRAFT_130648 [Gloeophyllum trabeum ATCC 11539]EPQ54276.1 hypothetical protein GLOTRDRAFT_130648 [Gloeophyllum trabeum ATCC 11539]